MNTRVMTHKELKVAYKEMGCELQNLKKLTLFKVVTYLDRKYKWATLKRPNGLKELVKVSLINVHNMKDEVVVDYYGSTHIKSDVITIELLEEGL